MKGYNNVDIQGRLFDYNLNSRSDNKGDYIYGTVTLEVDKDGTQATARFFARPKYNNGRPNRTYNMLDDMMAGNYISISQSPDDADWLGITGSISVSYFVGRNPSSSPDGLSTAMQIRGGFLNTNSRHQYSNKWKADLLITGVNEYEADPDKGYNRYARVKGFIIDTYRECVFEVGFDARSDAAINYVVGLTCSPKEPLFFPAWGQLMKVGTRHVNKNVFGTGEDDDVIERTTTRWVLTGLGEPYNFGDEADISQADYDKYRENLASYKTGVLESFKDIDNSPDLAF